MTPLQAVGADAASPDRRELVGFSAEREQLRVQSLDLQIELRDATGREAHLRFSHSELDYSRTYTRFGQVQELAPAGERPSDAAGRVAARETLRQAGFHVEHVELGYERSSVSVEGDIGLLQDFFSAPETAQRIFDGATGLGDGRQRTGAAFDAFVDEISAGVRDGFAQAREMLDGELAAVSEDTITLVEAMLAAFRERGPDGEPVSAEDFLGLIADSKNPG